MSLKKNKRKNTRSGQTILEVLVALGLIILFLSGIIVVELYALKNVSFAEKKSIATRLARQQLERARVIRDSKGIESLSLCEIPCFLNNQLTPVPITPTGTFGQSLFIVPATSSDCPLPEVTITPFPRSYKATATVIWDTNLAVTPPPKLELSSCLTDWR